LPHGGRGGPRGGGAGAHPQSPHRTAPFVPCISHPANKKALWTRAQQRVKSAFDVTTKHRLDDWADESHVPHQTSAN